MWVSKKKHLQLTCALSCCRVADTLPGGPWHTDCRPASVGEFWYNDWIADYLRDCKGDCEHIQASMAPLLLLIITLNAVHAALLQCQTTM